MKTVKDEDNEFGLDHDQIEAAMMMGDDFREARGIAVEIFGVDAPEVRVALVNTVLAYQEKRDQVEAIENLRIAQAIASRALGVERAGPHETFFFYEGLFGEDE